FAVVLLVAGEGGVPALAVEAAERREDRALGVGDRVAPAVVRADVARFTAVLALDLDAQGGAGLLGEADRDARTGEGDLRRAVSGRVDRLVGAAQGRGDRLGEVEAEQRDRVVRRADGPLDA